MSIVATCGASEIIEKSQADAGISQDSVVQLRILHL